MIRTKTFVKTIKRIGLLSGVGLIAISASAFPGTAASAAERHTDRSGGAVPLILLSARTLRLARCR